MVVFARDGLGGSVIDAVIATAGVSRGTFYNYFRSDDEVFRAVATEAGDQLLAVVEPLVLRIDDPAERVARGVRLVLAVAARHPLLAAFLARVGPAALGPESRAMANISRDLREGLARGRFVVDDPRLGFDLVTGPVLAAFHTLIGGEAGPGFAEAMAAAILADWASWKGRFKVLVPPSEKATVGLVEREAVTA